MNLLKIFILICLLILGTGTATAETFLVTDNFPLSTNGDNNIRLRYVEDGNYSDLKNFNSYLFAHPDSIDELYTRPIISRGERGRTKNRVNISRIYFMPDEPDGPVGVMQVTIPSAENGLHVSGTAVVESGNVHFLIYDESTRYSRPVWSSDHGESFDISLPAQKNPEVFFSATGKDGDQKNIGYWENLRIEYTADPNTRIDQPTNQETSPHEDTRVNGLDGTSQEITSEGTSPGNTSGGTTAGKGIPVLDSIAGFFSTFNWQAFAVIIAAIITSSAMIYTSKTKK